MAAKPNPSHDCEAVLVRCDRCNLRQLNRMESRSGLHARGCKGGRRHCPCVVGRYA